MNSVTVFEFDSLIAGDSYEGCQGVPPKVFQWLENRCIRTSEDQKTPWLRLVLQRGRRAVQVREYVGVIRVPGGFQIEVLPKIGKKTSGGAGCGDGDRGSGVLKARRHLIEMLGCLEGFRHIRLDWARVAASEMPLLEVFMGEFLAAVEGVVKRGVRSDYVSRQDDLFALRGKLLVSEQIRRNFHRGDRFFAEFDEFSPDRPENRLLHAALRRVLSMTGVHAHQRLARELCFVFAEIQESTDFRSDFQRVRLDREMVYYRDSLAWAKLILEEHSPLTGLGDFEAPSLLFPMNVVFEEYVAHQLRKQLTGSFDLKLQPRSSHLVEHRDQKWFFLKPDMLLREGAQNLAVLDAKWKLLESDRCNGTDKHLISQSDFYQVYTYGQYYLGGRGDLVLVYPKTDEFAEPLEIFSFPQASDLRLWVLPFCLDTRKLLMPSGCSLERVFNGRNDRIR